MTIAGRHFSAQFGTRVPGQRILILSARSDEVPRAWGKLRRRHPRRGQRSGLRIRLVTRICSCSRPRASCSIPPSPTSSRPSALCGPACAEYFTLPLIPDEVAGALARAAVREPAPPPAALITKGQMFVFLGTKGGCGVTSIAANFALRLRRSQRSQPSSSISDFRSAMWPSTSA